MVIDPIVPLGLWPEIYGPKQVTESQAKEIELELLPPISFD